MIKKLWPHARPYGRWIAAGVLCSALEAVFELLIPLVTLWTSASKTPTRRLFCKRAD